MKIDISKYTINQKLAFVAFFLGFLAIFMKDPSNAGVVSVNVNELSLKINDKSSLVTVEELADWLIQKKTDFKLVDIRDEKKFAEYSIPSSMNINPAKLLKSNISKSDKIILFSDDNIASAQAWFVLKSKNYKSVYMLKGGINEWKNSILFPSLPQNATAEEKARFNKMIEVSKFFGGNPQFAENDSLNSKPAIKQVMPKPTVSSASPATGGKPKREGC